MMSFNSDTYDNQNDANELEESSGSHEFREIVLQQSVTMLAYMDKTAHNTSLQAAMPEPQSLLGFSLSDLPVLIGAAIGAAGLILVVLIAILVWHCCKFRGRPDKSYCLDNSTPDDSSMKAANGTILPSESVVFLGSKVNQVATHAIAIKSDICQSILTRSQSVPLKEGKQIRLHVPNKQYTKRRPTSQPVHFPLSFQPVSSYSPKRIHSGHPHGYHRHMDEGENVPLALPCIPEVALRSTEMLHEMPSHALYASCNALDEPCTYSSMYTAIDSGATMKTRSLPLWGRARPRPLSTADDVNELYAKVSFSKKRKNRMRSDSAAAIAANKSRSSYMTIPFAHKDTDSLVDNEAVVVYDERTAL